MKRIGLEPGKDFDATKIEAIVSRGGADLFIVAQQRNAPLAPVLDRRPAAPGGGRLGREQCRIGGAEREEAVGARGETENRRGHGPL